MYLPTLLLPLFNDVDVSEKVIIGIERTDSE